MAERLPVIVTSSRGSLYMELPRPVALSLRVGEVLNLSRCTGYEDAGIFARQTIVGIEKVFDQTSTNEYDLYKMEIFTS